jgi:D-aminopeptidase
MKNLIFILFIFLFTYAQAQEKRGRIRDLGIDIGILKPGKYNAITDVQGVLVGHKTLIKGDHIRTGVTAILPHSGNIFQDKVPGAVYVINGFGKLMGTTQVEELGCIETPVVLTNTLNVPLVADAVMEYVLNMEGNERVFSVNPVVGETNDGGLNDIRNRHVKKEHVFEAIKNAKTGSVEEGCVGAGTGTSCLGFKGGIGTASRVLPQRRGGYTVGVLVQTNFGGNLTINGAPVGREMNKFYMNRDIPYDVDGSCMIVIATDAPVSPRNLKRMAKRVSHAMGRVGGTGSNGSGDYVISFSTYEKNRVKYFTRNRVKAIDDLQNDHMSPLFTAVIEATEEAILNSMFMAETVTGNNNRTLKAIPIEKTLEILKKYNALKWNEKIPPWNDK